MRTVESPALAQSPEQRHSDRFQADLSASSTGPLAKQVSSPSVLISDLPQCAIKDQGVSETEGSGFRPRQN